MIKLAIVDKDEKYLDRIGNFFLKYSSNITIFTFTDMEVAVKKLETGHIDFFLVNDKIEINDEILKDINENIVFCYLMEESDYATYKNKPAIFKYQKLEFIYKRIIDICASVLPESSSSIKSFDTNTSTVVFVSPAGGVGVSSLAVAFAKKNASMGKQVLYVNLEQTGSTDDFFEFSSEVDMNLRNVILAIKNKKEKLQYKLQSQVETDKTNVSFYRTPEVALDIKELKTDEIELLVSTLKSMDKYDMVIIDINFYFTPSVFAVFKSVDKIIFISDGQKISNTKLLRAYDAIEKFEDGENLSFSVLPKISLLYNKFGKSSREADTRLNMIGHIKRFESPNYHDIINAISDSSVLDKI
ncbi:MAG: AAA family ATPase [Oscillospiraceae bacterium]|jgi:cellulose biosynthesis protein BcsQ|nr:AAA family ATPase [Oscillospiraceae bacterium]